MPPDTPKSGITAVPTATPAAGVTPVTGTPIVPASAPEASDAPITRQRVLDAEAWAEQGIQLCRKARWKDAIEPLRRAAELHSEHPTAHYYLGEAYNHVDDLTAALASFEAAVRANPTFWRAHKGVGIVLDRMRRPREAAAAYQRARELQRASAGSAGGTASSPGASSGGGGGGGGGLTG